MKSAGEMSATPPAMEKAASGVKSALRVLEVLEYFARAAAPATLARLVTELNMPKSSCHALLETLRQQGYIYWLGKDHGYYPTRRWRELGDLVSRHDPVLALASATLHEIRDRFQETAILAKREGKAAMYLEVVEPDRTLRFAAEAGQIKPLHSGASGRALLSMLDPAEQAQLLNKVKRKSYSPNTVTELEPLLKMIEEGTQRGYHIAIGEYQPDTTAIAAAFQVGTEGYALLVGGPTQRLQGMHEEIGQMLVAQAKAIGARM